MSKTLQVLVTTFLILLVVVVTILLTLQSVNNSTDDSDSDPAFAGGTIEIPLTNPASCTNNFSEDFSKGLDEKTWQSFSLPADESGVYAQDGYLTGDENLSILNVSTLTNPQIYRGQNTIRTFTGNFEASVDTQMIAEQQDKNKGSATWLMAYDNFFNRFGIGLRVDKNKSETSTILEVTGFNQKHEDIWSTSASIDTFNNKSVNLTIKRINNIIKFYFEVDGIKKHLGTYNNVYSGPVKLALFNEVNTNGQVSNVVSAFDNLEVQCSESSEVTSPTAAECSIQDYKDEFTTLNTNYWQYYLNETDPLNGTSRVYFQANPSIVNSKLSLTNLYFAQAQEIVANQRLIKGVETLKEYSGDFRVSIDAESLLDENDAYDISGVWLMAFDSENFTNKFGIGYATEVNDDIDAQPLLQAFSEDLKGSFSTRRELNSNNNKPTKLVLERVGSNMKSIITRENKVLDVVEYEGVFSGKVYFALYTEVSSEQPLIASATFDNFEISCPQFEATNDLILLSDTFTLTQTQECSPIDIDGDGELTLVDLASFANYYGNTCIQSNEANNSICGSIDTNNDGEVDLNDLSNFAINYSLSSCQ